MRVAVLADCHIDHGIHGFWAIEAWQNATRHIAETNHDVCVIAGDLFHHGHPTSEAIMSVLDGLATMTDAGVEVVVVSGNHEWIRVRTREKHRSPIPILGQIEGVTTAIEPKGVRVGDLWVGALPWPAPGAHSSGLTQSEQVEWLAEEAADVTGPKLVAGHVGVTEAMKWPGSESEMAALQEASKHVSASELDDVDTFGAVCLGHIHKRMDLTDTVGYVGSLEAFTFIDAERVGGFSSMEWEDYGDGWGGAWSNTFVPVGVRRFATVTVWDDLSDYEPGTLIRLKLEPEDSRLDFDADAAEDAGLLVVETVDKRAVAVADEEAEQIAESEPLEAEELLERWSSQRRLSQRESQLLRKAAEVELGWSCCDDDEHGHETVDDDLDW